MQWNLLIPSIKSVQMLDCYISDNSVMNLANHKTPFPCILITLWRPGLFKVDYTAVRSAVEVYNQRSSSSMCKDLQKVHYYQRYHLKWSCLWIEASVKRKRTDDAVDWLQTFFPSKFLWQQSRAIFFAIHNGDFNSRHSSSLRFCFVVVQWSK